MKAIFAFVSLLVLAALLPERSMGVPPEISPQKGGQKGDVVADSARPEEASFRVRQGVIGAGFDTGATGKLRVSALGLEFLKIGSSRPKWSVRWAELAAASKDGGIWDLPFPLVIVDRSGARRYIALLDERGRCIPGDPLLFEISTRHPKGKAAVPGPPPEGDQARDPGAKS